MHEKGSTCPPPAPPTVTDATEVFNNFNDLSRRYGSLMRQWAPLVPAIADIFAAYPLLTRNEIQNMVNRAQALVQRVGNNHQINQPGDRRPHEELKMLERLYKTRSGEMDNLEDKLDELEVSQQQQQRRPAPSRPSNPYHPSDEVLQLRGENTMLLNENSALSEDLENAEALIRSLRDQLADAEGKDKGREDNRGEDESVDEGGDIRGAKRRRV